jgi:hypothetical protein
MHCMVAGCARQLDARVSQRSGAPFTAMSLEEARLIRPPCISSLRRCWRFDSSLVFVRRASGMEPFYFPMPYTPSVKNMDLLGLID